MKRHHRAMLLAVLTLLVTAHAALAQNGVQNSLGSLATQQALQQLTQPQAGDLVQLFRGPNGQAVFGQYDSSFVYQTPQGTSVPGVVIMCFTGLTTAGGTPVAIPCPSGAISNVAGQQIGGSPVAGLYSPPLVVANGPQFNCGRAVLSKWNPVTGCFDR